MAVNPTIKGVVTPVGMSMYSPLQGITLQGVDSPFAEDNFHESDSVASEFASAAWGGVGGLWSRDIESPASMISHADVSTDLKIDRIVAEYSRKGRKLTAEEVTVFTRLKEDHSVFGARDFPFNRNLVMAIVAAVGEDAQALRGVGAWFNADLIRLFDSSAPSDPLWPLETKDIVRLFVTIAVHGGKYRERYMSHVEDAFKAARDGRVLKTWDESEWVDFVCGLVRVHAVQEIEYGHEQLVKNVRNLENIAQKADPKKWSRQDLIRLTCEVAKKSKERSPGALARLGFMIKEIDKTQYDTPTKIRLIVSLTQAGMNINNYFCINGHLPLDDLSRRPDGSVDINWQIRVYDSLTVFVDLNILYVIEEASKEMSKLGWSLNAKRALFDAFAKCDLSKASSLPFALTAQGIRAVDKLRGGDWTDEKRGELLARVSALKMEEERSAAYLFVDLENVLNVMAKLKFTADQTIDLVLKFLEVTGNRSRMIRTDWLLSIVEPLQKSSVEFRDIKEMLIPFFANQDPTFFFSAETQNGVADLISSMRRSRIGNALTTTVLKTVFQKIRSTTDMSIMFSENYLLSLVRGLKKDKWSEVEIAFLMELVGRYDSRTGGLPGSLGDLLESIGFFLRDSRYLGWKKAEQKRLLVTLLSASEVRVVGSILRFSLMNTSEEDLSKLVKTPFAQMMFILRVARLAGPRAGTAFINLPKIIESLRRAKLGERNHTDTEIEYFIYKLMDVFAGDTSLFPSHFDTSMANLAELRVKKDGVFVAPPRRDIMGFYAHYMRSVQKMHDSNGLPPYLGLGVVRFINFLQCWKPLTMAEQKEIAVAFSRMDIGDNVELCFERLKQIASHLKNEGVGVDRIIEFERNILRSCKGNGARTQMLIEMADILKLLKVEGLTATQSITFLERFTSNYCEENSWEPVAHTVHYNLGEAFKALKDLKTISGPLRATEIAAMILRICSRHDVLANGQPATDNRKSLYHALPHLKSAVKGANAVYEMRCASGMMDGMYHPLQIAMIVEDQLAMYDSYVGVALMALERLLPAIAMISDDPHEQMRLLADFKTSFLDGHVPLIRQRDRVGEFLMTASIRDISVLFEAVKTNGDVKDRVYLLKILLKLGLDPEIFQKLSRERAFDEHMPTIYPDFSQRYSHGLAAYFGTAYADAKLPLLRMYLHEGAKIDPETLMNGIARQLAHVLDSRFTAKDILEIIEDRPREIGFFVQKIGVDEVVHILKRIVGYANLLHPDFADLVDEELMSFPLTSRQRAEMAKTRTHRMAVRVVFDHLMELYNAGDIRGELGQWPGQIFYERRAWKFRRYIAAMELQGELESSLPLRAMLQMPTFLHLLDGEWNDDVARSARKILLSDRTIATVKWALIMLLPVLKMSEGDWRFVNNIATNLLMGRMLISGFMQKILAEWKKESSTVLNSRESFARVDDILVPDVIASDDDRARWIDLGDDAGLVEAVTAPAGSPRDLAKFIASVAADDRIDAEPIFVGMIKAAWREHLTTLFPDIIIMSHQDFMQYLRSMGILENAKALYDRLQDKMFADGALLDGIFESPAKKLEAIKVVMHEFVHAYLRNRRHHIKGRLEEFVIDYLEEYFANKIAQIIVERSKALFGIEDIATVDLMASLVGSIEPEFYRHLEAVGAQAYGSAKEYDDAILRMAQNDLDGYKKLIAMAERHALEHLHN